MNTQAFKILEFDSLRSLVRRKATTEMGKARIDQLAPVARLRDLEHSLECVAEIYQKWNRSPGIIAGLFA